MYLTSTVCAICKCPIRANVNGFCGICNVEEYEYYYFRDTFGKQILNLLPQKWVYGFGAVEALGRGVFSLDDFIEMTYHFTPKEDINSITKLCIKISHPDDYYTNSPYSILNMLHYMGFKFNGEMYELARRDKCEDSKRILRLICYEPATKIQRAWLRYRERRCNRAVRIIQQKAREWLYRPGGPMMKKFEEHFNQLATTQF